MSLSTTRLLGALAAAQGTLVLPALGEDYAGKSAGLVAALLMVAAGDAEAGFERRAAALPRLAALLGDAMPDAPGVIARFDAAMAALERLHAEADARDRALAARCRNFLADWTASEVIAPAF